MASFKITGRPFLLRFWQKRLEKAQSKVKRYEDITIDISSVLLPTPSTMIIKFTNLNKGVKYELVVQGNYGELYKRKTDGETISPEEVQAELIIRGQIQNSYSIND